MVRTTTKGNAMQTTIRHFDPILSKYRDDIHGNKIGFVSAMNRWIDGEVKYHVDTFGMNTKTAMFTVIGKLHCGNYDYLSDFQQRFAIATCSLEVKYS